MFQTNLWSAVFPTKQKISKGPLVALLDNWGDEFEGTTARCSYHSVKINNFKLGQALAEKFMRVRASDPRNCMHITTTCFNLQENEESMVVKQIQSLKTN